MSVFVAVGKSLRALSIADFGGKDDAGKRQCNSISQDDWRRPEADAIQHPAYDAGAEHHVHAKADVLRAFVAKYFQNLRQSSVVTETALHPGDDNRSEANSFVRISISQHNPDDRRNDAARSAQ